MKLDQLNDLMVVTIFQQCSMKANELNAINLAQGVPEPRMEEQINEALAASLSGGWQYTSPRGLEYLRGALATEYNNEFDKEDILITSGCTESLYLGVYAASKVYGSKIAFLEPSYPYYMGLATLLDLEAYPIAMDFNNGSITPNWNLVESIIASGVKIFLLNTPHNPSGWVMSTNDAKYLRDLAEKYGVFLIVDEAYRYYTYTSCDANLALKILYENNKNILLVGSASKLFSATGLRIGWMLGSKNILDIAFAIHLYTTYCHPNPLQQVTATLLSTRTADWFNGTKAHYSEKQASLLKGLQQAGFQCGAAAGGHFLLADYSAIKPELESEQFSEYFAKQFGVMALPASPFYRKKLKPRQVRFSFSVSMDTIQKALERLSKV